MKKEFLKCYFLSKGFNSIKVKISNILYRANGAGDGSPIVAFWISKNESMGVCMIIIMPLLDPSKGQHQLRTCRFYWQVIAPKIYRKKAQYYHLIIISGFILRSSAIFSPDILHPEIFNILTLPRAEISVTLV